MKLKKLKGLLTPDSKITIMGKKGDSLDVRANDESFDTYGDYKIAIMQSDVKVNGKKLKKKTKLKSEVVGIDSSIMEMQNALGIDSSGKDNDEQQRHAKDNRSFKKRWENERNKRDRYENKEDFETKRSSNILNEFAESTLKTSNEAAEEKKKLNEEAPYAAAIDNDSKNRKGFQKKRRVNRDQSQKSEESKSKETEE